MAEKLYPKYPILIVDDEIPFLEALEADLFAEGFTHVRPQNHPVEALRLLGRETFDAVLLDVSMPQMSGKDLLGRIKQKQPHLPVIMITKMNDVKMAVSCITGGAMDYLLKPVSRQDLAACLQRALDIRRSRRENSPSGRKNGAGMLLQPEVFDTIITQDAGMLEIFRYCEAIGPGGEPVFITGETGTGKELVARAIHLTSGRTGGFIATNITGLDDLAVSDILFGHTRGAFTGANRSRAGYLEKLAGGTLFLDEINDISRANQVRLLRAVREKEYFPLGSDEPKISKVRIVVATNLSLAVLENPEVFNPEFYYRIKTHHVHLPPLRERKADIPLLFSHFLSKAAAVYAKPLPCYSSQLLDRLMAYNFPGNVLELRSMVFDAVASQQGKALSVQSFEKQIPSSKFDSFQTGSRFSENGVFQHLDSLPTLKEAGRILVEEALRRSHGNQRTAAALLGITPQALSSRVRKLKG